MLLKNELRQLVEQGCVASTRVVPVPFTNTWCVDIIVRTPLEVGSVTDTVASPPDDSNEDGLRTFSSIDEAAQFLGSVGISSFVVDMNDSVSFTSVDSNMMRVVETTMRVWNNNDDGVAINSSTAA